MLNTSTINSILPLALDYENVNLNAITGSALSHMSIQTIERAKFNYSVSINNALDNESDMDFIGQLVKTSSEDNAVTYENHQLVLDTTVKNVTRIVKNNIYLTRNVVLPLILDYTKRLNEIVNIHTCVSGIALNITEDMKSSILTNNTVMDLVTKSNGKPDYNLELPRWHQDIGIVEMEQIIKTGNSRFDSEIEKWYALNNMSGLLQQVYREIFLKGAAHNVSIGKYISSNDYHKALLALLLSWGLTRNVQDGIPISLKEYELKMAAVSNMCINIIAVSVSSLKSQTNTKKLIVSFPPAGREYKFNEPERNDIIVNRAVYQEFLSRGGTPELIFGSYLSDRNTNLNGILENAKKYERAYDRVVAQGKLIQGNRVVGVIKDALKSFSNDIVKDIAELQEKDEINLSTHGRIQLMTEHYHESVNEFLYNIRVNEVNDLYELVKRFICLTYFKDTSVYDLLVKFDYIDPEGKMNPEDVGILASVDFIVDWLLAQIDRSTSVASTESYY